MPVIPGAIEPRYARPSGALQPDPRLTLLVGAPLTINQEGARDSIPDGAAYWLENLCPVGPGNLQTVNAPSTVYTNARAITFIEGVSFQNTNYMVLYDSTGVRLYDIAGASMGAEISGGVFTSAQGRVAAWQNTDLLFANSALGYFSYDGTTWSAITGAGVPTAPTDIEVYDGRVWLSEGTIAYCSGAGGFDASYWLPANGAGFEGLTGRSIRSDIRKMMQANGLLFLFTDSAVNIFSNINTPIGLDPPTPSIQNNTIDAVTGCGVAWAGVSPRGLYLVYANRAGFFEMYGTSRQNLSNVLPDLWPYLDVNEVSTSSGEVFYAGRIWSALNVQIVNHPLIGTKWVTLLVDDTGQWWAYNWGVNVTQITTVYINGLPTLYGTDGTKVYLFAGGTEPAGAIMYGKLYSLEDAIAKKEGLQAGVLIEQMGDPGATTAFALSIDSDNGTLVTAAGPPPGSYSTNPRVLLYAGIPGINTRTVGFRLTSTGYPMKIRAFGIDYKLRDRWTS